MPQIEPFKVWWRGEQRKYGTEMTQMDLKLPRRDRFCSECCRWLSMHVYQLLCIKQSFD